MATRAAAARVGLIVALVVATALWQVSPGAAPVLAHADHPASLALSPSSGSFARGCSFTLDIVLNTGGRDTVGTDVLLLYDPAKLTTDAASIANGTTYATYPGKSVDQAGGRLAVSGVSVSPPFNGTGQFARVAFAVRPDAAVGPTQIRFDFDPNDREKTTDSNVVESGTSAEILGTATSGSFVLGTGTCGEPIVPPENDRFDRATPVDPARLPLTLTADTTHATMEPGEEDATYCAPTKTVWYTYTPTVTAGLTVSTTGSDFNTVVGVYTGDSMSTLRTIGLDNCDNSPAYRQGPASKVTFLAKAGTTYRIQLGGWMNDVSGDDAGRLNASFQKIERFNVAVTAPTGGTVTSAPSGISCGTACSADFAADGQVTLTANPSPGWVFRGWYARSTKVIVNLCPDSGPCTVTLDADHTVSAGFTQVADLAVSLSASPDPVAVGQDLTYAITVRNTGPATAQNVYVYLPIVYYSQSSFGTPGAVGAPCSYSRNYRGEYVSVYCDLDDIAAGESKTFTIDRRVEEIGTVEYNASLSSGTLDPTSANDRASIQTTVVRDSRLLTVTRSAVEGGNGTVTGTPGGIACGDVCQKWLAQGTSVTLTAVPAPGSVFAGWSGACAGTSSCVVGMNADTTVTATFRSGNTACSPPRPRVGVESVLAGDGRIRVTITAGAGAVRSLRFGTAQRPLVNAAIDVELPTGAVRVTGGAPLELPPNTTRQTFYVSRPNPNAATTVPLVVVDACGEWETFVGRGVGGP